MQRVNRLHRLRRNTEAHRIKRNLVEEAAPLRINLVARLLVGVVVQLGVPAILGYFADHAGLVEDQLPVIIGAVGLGQGDADADDGNVGGLRIFGTLDTRERLFIEQRLCAARDVLVQVSQRLHAITHGRNLADHVHAVGELLLHRHFDHAPGIVAVHALGGDAQTAEVQVFQHVTDFFRALALADQPTAGIVEVVRELRIHATRGVAWAGFQIHRALAAQGLGLETFHHRAGTDDLLREQIGRTHQAADLHAALGQRRGHGRNHR